MSSPSGNVSGGRSPNPSVKERLRSIDFKTVWRTPKGILGILGILVLLGLLTIAILFAVVRVPDPNEQAQAQTSIIYFSDGQTEMHRFSEVNRESVPLSDVPQHVQDAMLAAEDRNFYDNPGFSLSGISRAVWAAVSGGPTQGGSTITQQYVKNYFLTQDQTIGRKVRELIISIKVEQQQSKQEILQNYLNTIYFGRGASGIQAASRAYFNKTVDQLSVGEGALLASVIRAPSLYDPAEGPEAEKNARERVDYVLDGMVGQGWLTAAQRAGVTFPQVVESRTRSGASGPNGYIVQQVQNELSSKIGLSEAEIDRGGLRITTTISRDAQTDAITAVQENRPSGGRASAAAPPAPPSRSSRRRGAGSPRAGRARRRPRRRLRLRHGGPPDPRARSTRRPNRPRRSGRQRATPRPSAARVTGAPGRAR